MAADWYGRIETVDLRLGNKKRREMGLGSFGDFTLADARDMAAAARQLLKEGIDPLDARRETARQERDEALAAEEETAKETSRVPSFKNCAEEYIAAHEDGWNNAKHRLVLGRCRSNLVTNGRARSG